LSGKKRILIACGTGIATSTVAADNVQRSLEARGLDVEVDQCKAGEVASYVASSRPDAIVATTPISDDYGVPVFMGIPFLTGVGVEPLVDEIMESLSREPDRA
jgi:galactitol PTS system EIIB component